MAEPSTSTSPHEKLRWKFVMSSSADQKHHSTQEKTVNSLRARDVLHSVRRCSSQSAPSGTVASTDARTPARSPVMRV